MQFERVWTRKKRKAGGPEATGKKVMMSAVQKGTGEGEKLKTGSLLIISYQLSVFHFKMRFDPVPGNCRLPSTQVARE